MRLMPMRVFVADCSHESSISLAACSTFSFTACNIASSSLSSLVGAGICPSNLLFMKLRVRWIKLPNVSFRSALIFSINAVHVKLVSLLSGLVAMRKKRQ